MAAITVRRNVLLLPIKPLLSLQGLYHQFVEAGDPKRRPPTEDDYLIFKQGEIDVSKWKKMDARSLGITPTMVPASPYTVMHILRNRGFEAYLVGGCVRDLLLNRPPKDFDVITTANLDQISEQFHRCQVVGLRFPVCRVFIKGSVVEVSSFDTLAKDAEGKEKFLESQMPKGCDNLDLMRWKNSMHRDFTINSLFLDPFLQKIYDYNDGMKDLSELKLRTLVPAQLSFTEDSARILRGLRIAARLGLSLSKEIKSAIFKHLTSVSRLSQSRVTMELNYMLSFGAAESSFSLLHKYHLLEVLLPFQAAYIFQQSTRCAQSSVMLIKLLSHLDKLVTCDRPCGSRLWIGLLGFHLALATNPQHPFVILTFASVLYHQNWEDGLKFARRNGQSQTLVSFNPETLEPYKFLSDDEIAEKVNELVMLVLYAIDVLVGIESPHKTMEKFPDFPYSGLVFIPQNQGHNTKLLFDVIAHKVETYNKGRASFDINYDLLKRGDLVETRFALGKIILNTMGCGVDLEFDLDRDSDLNEVSSCLKGEYIVNEKEDRKQPPLPSKLDSQLASDPVGKPVATLNSIMQQKPERIGISFDPKNADYKANKPAINRSMEKLICMLESQNLEERRAGNAEVEVDRSVVEDDETGVGSLLLSVQTNCKRAIEEAGDSPAEIRKLNQFLVNFVGEQKQRKKTEYLETSTLTSSSIGTPQIESEQSKVTTRSKKVTRVVKSSINGEKRKQRVCSYCKEAGHYKTRCPKRKMDEAASLGDIEST
ncbi:putative polynucleotide adenylyltransferase [Helianthus annuus]|nr:putative polynucleotide adenylyltransferase [Helianthus annuus]